MASFERILPVLENVEHENSEEEYWNSVLRKLKQKCYKEKVKRQSFKIAIEKVKFSMRNKRFSFALNQAQKKCFTTFRNLLEENFKMQQKLVEKVKSHDWELVNGLWRFKIKTLQKQKTEIAHNFRNQKDLWELKIRSLPEYNDIEKTLTLFEEKRSKLLEFEQQWKIRKEAVDHKYQRTNNHFEQIKIALATSEKILADLQQEAENLEKEIKRLDAFKLNEMRLIKNLENDLKKRAHIQTKEFAEGNSKYYGRIRFASFIDAFNLSPLPVLKMGKMGEKTLIEDRKGFAPMISSTPEKLINFPEHIAENVSRIEKSQLENTENVKIRPDKQIKILEQVILKNPVPCTRKGTVSEQNDSSLFVSAAESLSCKAAEILNISQNKSTSDLQDLKQSNEETDGENLFDRQLMKQNVLYRTRVGEKDKIKTNQANKNILKQEDLKDKEEKEKRPKIVKEDEKSLSEENAETADLKKMSVNETKSNNMPFVEIEEQRFPRDAVYKQKIIQIGNVETDVNNKFEPQESLLNKTSSNVKKRKPDKPFSQENLKAKQFKFKENYSDSSSKSDFKPGPSGKVSVRDHSGSENNMDNILRKAFELCKVPESTDTKPEHTEISLNEDFESFFTNLMTIEMNSKDLENCSLHSSGAASGWGAFGNNFKMGDNNNDDKGFFK